MNSSNLKISKEKEIVSKDSSTESPEEADYSDVQNIFKRYIFRKLHRSVPKFYIEDILQLMLISFYVKKHRSTYYMFIDALRELKLTPATNNNPATFKRYNTCYINDIKKNYPEGLQIQGDVGIDDSRLLLGEVLKNNKYSFTYRYAFLLKFLGYHLREIGEILDVSESMASHIIKGKYKSHYKEVYRVKNSFQWPIFLRCKRLTELNEILARENKSLNKKLKDTLRKQALNEASRKDTRDLSVKAYTHGKINELSKAGMTNKEIGKVLGLSAKTIRTHKNRMKNTNINF